MRFPIALGAALLAAPLMLQPAAAQRPPELVYSQPLTEDAIRLVQERLRETGAYPGQADGVWGPSSQQALERFQQSRGLQVTGQLNQATAATLGLRPEVLVAERPDAEMRSGAGVPAMGAVSSATLSADAVRNVQQRLRALGFYRGGVDGIWGPGTQGAVEQFQQGRGLQPTGQLNPATVQALGLDPNTFGAR